MADYAEKEEEDGEVQVGSSLLLLLLLRCNFYRRILPRFRSVGFDDGMTYEL